MAEHGRTIKGVYKSEEPSGNRFTLTFDPSWSETPKRSFRGSYRLIPTPSGSKAKPRVGCFRDGNLIFSAGARNGCYDTLLSVVDKKVTTKCEKRESILGEGHYLLVELEPDFHVNPKKTYILDTETTGVDTASDEVLSLAIVDLEGNMLFNDLAKPRHKKSWKEAQSVNHISPAMAKDARPLDERISELDFLLDESALIVGYNIDFDLAMLRNSGLPVVNHYTYDVMDRFADKHTNGARKKLHEAASYYGYSFEPHNALDDAKATAHIFRNMEKLTDNPISYSLNTSTPKPSMECGTTAAMPHQHSTQDWGGKSNPNSKYVAIAVVVICLLLGAMLTFVLYPELFWGILLVGIFLLWLIGKFTR